MSSYDDPAPDRAKPFRRQLEIGFNELAEVQDQAQTERLATGGYSNQTVVALEDSVLAFRRRLLPFVDKNDAVADLWERYQLDLVPEETAVVVGETEDRVTIYGTTERGGEKKIRRAEPDRLMVWGDALMQAYAELGFGPEMQESDYRTRGGDAV